MIFQVWQHLALHLATNIPNPYQTLANDLLWEAELVEKREELHKIQLPIETPKLLRGPSTLGQIGTMVPKETGMRYRLYRHKICCNHNIIMICKNQKTSVCVSALAFGTAIRLEFVVSPINKLWNVKFDPGVPITSIGNILQLHQETHPLDLFQSW